MAPRKCSLETCIDPEEIGCNRGHEFLEQCPHWTTDASAAVDDDSDPSEVDSRNDASAGDTERQLHLPWTGNSLGSLDLELVTACNHVTLIGVVGAYNAGKTSLLTLIYLLIQRAEQSTGTFAGSWTLLGWENLAANFRWKAGESGPKFPPHTTRRAGRRPGLLHVAFRDDKGLRRDFLLTDPPGEWFNSWAQNEFSDSAEGARWIHRYADRFIFLVDREALSNNERGKNRDALRDLARRLSKNLDGRPVAVVWTKSDVAISSIIQEDLQDCINAEFPNRSDFNVRMRFGDETRKDVEEPALALIEWAFGSERQEFPDPISIPVSDPSDLFLAYRGQSTLR